MQDNFNINDWRTKMIRESLEEAEVPKKTPKDNNFSQASDKLYKKVTGEDPKPASKNKFRDIKESHNSGIYESIEDDLDNMISINDQIDYLEGIIKFCQKRSQKLKDEQ